MNTVYNPLTGEWERLDDLNRPMPTIERPVRQLLVNNTVSFVPTQSSSHAPNHTDILGNTSESRATVSVFEESDADIIMPDAWRVRRFVLVCNRGSSGSTQVTISAALWGRLRRADGTYSNWRRLAEANDSAANGEFPIRFVFAPQTASVFCFEQYRITIRRDVASTTEPTITLVRLYIDY